VTATCQHYKDCGTEFCEIYSDSFRFWRKDLHVLFDACLDAPRTESQLCHPSFGCEIAHNVMIDPPPYNRSDHRCRWLLSGAMYSVPAAYCLKPGKYTAIWQSGRDYINVCAQHSTFYREHAEYKLRVLNGKLTVMT